MAARQSHCPECGAILTKPRSIQDHRRFFAVIAAAYNNWPHGHPFQPSSAEHLRAYLLVEAGYAETTPVFVELDAVPEAARQSTVKLVSLAVEAAIAAALAQKAYAFVRVMGDTIVVSRPKSINFAALSQREFGPVRQACEGIIEAALGVKADEALKARAA